MIPDHQLFQLKADNPCDQVASQWVCLRKHGKGFIGPCPICSKDRQSKTDGRFEIKDRDGWVCAACQSGGDRIALIMKVEGITDFLAAVERLGGVREIDHAAAEQRERERAAEQEKRDRDSNLYREKERGKLYDIWNLALQPAGMPPEEYFGKRKIPLPPDAGRRLRCVPEMPYFAHGGKDAPVLWRGPTMVAPIVGPDHKFRGLHFTYIDLAQPKGKARILHPETGEVMPARKVRGTKAGGHIPLVGPHQPRRLVMGEGIETTLAMWSILTDEERDGVGFWAAVYLGNLSGRATGTISHPTLKDAAGRARRVPGPDADLESLALTVPAAVDEVLLLADADSDRTVTECALFRAQTRLTRYDAVAA
jgi:hypothetical protein